MDQRDQAKAFEEAQARVKAGKDPLPDARSCFWPYGLSSGDPYLNIAYPDAATFYWGAVFTMPHRAKLHGLTILAERLAKIRHERKPESRYASLENCQSEIRAAEALLRQAHIPILDTTTMSVEEIAISILYGTGLIKRLKN